MTGEIDLEKIYHTESLQENQKNYYFSETKAFHDASGELLYLQFTIDPFHHIEIKNYLIDTILISIPILLLFIFLSSVILTKWTLKPIIHLTRTVQSFSLTTGKRLLPLSKNNDEIDKLSQTLNNLVIQNRESFETLILFTATLSHELRLPITAIKGEAEVCLSKPRTVIEYQSILQSVIEELDKLTKMINRLFSLNRIDLGDDPIQWQVIDIGKILNTLISFYDALAETRKINLTGVFELNTFFIKGDVDKIQEIFSNLIENAIKYTGENGQISVSISRKGNQIAISIEDTGIGISAADQDRIFDRFFQVQKDRTGNQSGTGLGLSIVKQLLTLHHGSITVQSELQKGSCFTVYLPVSS